MLNSMIELNQKEIKLVSGGKNEAVVDCDGSNVPASSPYSVYSEKALAVASAVGGYAWYTAEAMLALVGIFIVSAVAVTTICLVKKKCHR